MTKHLLTIKDQPKDVIEHILQFAKEMKDSPGRFERLAPLNQKYLVMIFQKPSSRTRISFEVAMKHLGGGTVVLKEDEIGLGSREPIKDIARVVSRYADSVMIRAKNHADIEEYAKYSSIPVINGLSDIAHPCQALADFFTIKEHFPMFEGVRICYLGDGNNVCQSLINMATKLGVELIVSCPDAYKPVNEDGTFKWEPDPQSAIRNATVVYTDVWTSMGQEQEKEQRLADFQKYSLTPDLMSLASDKAIVLHCLPAHRGEEITDEVIEGPQSRVFDQAENRLHAQKSILFYLMKKEYGEGE